MSGGDSRCRIIALGCQRFLVFALVTLEFGLETVRLLVLTLMTLEFGLVPLPCRRPHPVIIERIRSQPGNVLIGDIADIPILVSRHVTVKGTARGDVQPVTGRIAYAAPVRSEAAGSLVSCL